jgi:uncharacterized repeat protein (TIGR02543 family)
MSDNPIEYIFNVFYNGNGNTGGTVPADGRDYETGDRVTVLGRGSLVRAGHTFAGWSREGVSGAYQAGNTFNMPMANVYLTAIWTPIGGTTEPTPTEPTPTGPPTTEPPAEPPTEPAPPANEITEEAEEPEYIAIVDTEPPMEDYIRNLLNQDVPRIGIGDREIILWSLVSLILITLGIMLAATKSANVLRRKRDEEDLKNDEEIREEAGRDIYNNSAI